MKSKPRKLFSTSAKPENRQQLQSFDMAPVNKEWNLYDIETGNEIIPDKIGNESKIAMSAWELHNFAIQIVRNDIENEGGSVLSFCDLLEVNPQIWFKDKTGRICWVVAKHITQKKEENHLNWAGLECKYPKLMPYDGFFASVQFVPIQNIELIRGDSMKVKFDGLKRIYVC